MARGGKETAIGEGAGPANFWGSISPEEVANVVSRLTDGIAVLDRDLRYRYLNEPAAKMLDRTVDGLLGKHIWTEFPEAVGHPVHLAFDQATRERQAVTVIEHFEPLDAWFENRIFPIEEDATFVVFRDVTEQQRAKKDLQEQSRRLSDAERIMRFGVWKWEIAKTQVTWSEQLQRIYGLPPGEFEGTLDGFLERVHPDDRSRVWSQVQSSMQSHEPFVFEERIVRPNGDVRVLLSEGHPILKSDGEIEALVGICHDITDRIATEEALGTSERRMRAIIDNTPSVITVRDLEGRYVMTNSEASRVFGISPDALIGRRCEDVVGEEIAVRQRASDLSAAAGREPVYDQIVLRSDGEPRTFTTVTFPLPDEKGLPAEMCTIATDVTDSQEREVKRLERISWEERIDAAIAQDRMLVFAQPIIDLRTGAQASNELLVRMITPGEAPEVLPPAAFLPAAEHFGLIQRIDAWMVRQALERTNGSISEVNLSAVTLCDGDARAEIVQLLEAAPERAGQIIFEITETAVAEHLGAASEFAEDVTNLGCRLALDDFGTGFGSLTYLNNLPLSFIKIDMSFVRDLAATPQDDRLVRSVIEVAGVFGLQTIAEGIEDESTLELLRELGTDYAQGFHLGRPAPLPAARLH